MNKKTSSLLQGGLILTATTAVLYAAHNAKNNGFLSVFNLDPDSLDQNLHQILYQGFLLLFPVVFKIFAWCIGILFLYSFLFIPVLQDSVKSKRLYLRVKHSIFGKRKRSNLFSHHQKATLIYAGIAISIFLLIILLASFERSGVTNAQAILKSLEGPTKDLRFINVKIDDKYQKLALLSCGSRNCAGIDPKSKEIFYFNQTQYSYVLVPKKDQVKHPKQNTCKYGNSWICLDKLIQAMACNKSK